MNLNSCGIRMLNIKCLGLLSLLFKLPFAVWATNFCLLCRPSARLHCVPVLVCFSLVWLLISQQLIQFLLLVQETSVAGLNSYQSFEMHCKIAKTKAPLRQSLMMSKYQRSIPKAFEDFPQKTNKS